MLCPRCSYRLQNVTEYVIEDENFIYVREYFCATCKCAMIEKFDDVGLFSSEWIDFNV